MKYLVAFLVASLALVSAPKVQLGADLFFESGHLARLQHKRVALVTNQTGVDGELRTTLSRLLAHQKGYQVVALFSPEHGVEGVAYADEKVHHTKVGEVACYSLHGDHRRPTEEMLKTVDVVIYDIQEVGTRSYTYATTLYYVMEEAAKRGIEVIVLDRPNPLGGVVDGPMLEQGERSFVGYINVPYCHGMTIGELARFFNQEYQIRCKLQVVAMKGWKRGMSFAETGLIWMPTSPQIAEVDTPFYYPMTGLLGDLSLVSIGVGYTLPFKIVGAPWIVAEELASALNGQNLPGVHFLPFHFKPFFGLYKQELCHGVRLVITDGAQFRPVTTGYLIMGVLKSLYPKEVMHRLKKLPLRKQVMFHHINGTSRIWELLVNDRFPGWKMASIDAKERQAFLEKRKQYLLY